MSVYDPGQPSGEPQEPSPPPAETPRPQPPQRGRGIRWWIPAAAGCGCLLALFVALALVAGLVGALSGTEGTGPKVALIHVDGIITSGSDSGLFGGGIAVAERIGERLEKARKDSNVKAIVLRINSPGGSAAASEEIYSEIRRVKASKPIYASMGDVAASGGYYVASACDRIFADGSTVTGSIGVIMESADLSGLFDKLGVDIEVVKSGKFKDIGSSHRPMTPEERSLIQGMIDDTYEQFIEAVSHGRRMPKARVRELATGRLFTGRQAHRRGLVDEIGGLRQAVLAAARAGGIKGEPNVARYDRRGGLLGLIEGRAAPQRLTLRDYEMIADRLVRRLASPSNRLDGLR